MIAAMLRRILLLPVLLFALMLPAAAQEFDIKLPDKLQPCECLECLKLFQLSAKAERKAYEDRLPIALKNMQVSIDDFAQNLPYTKGKILFCALWSTYEDEMTLLREYTLPDIQRKIFGDQTKCLPLAGGGTSPKTCQIDPLAALTNDATAPCEQIHLAILAHELVHAEDCEWNKDKPLWLPDEGKCAEVFAGKATPTTEQFLEFVKMTFRTEEHAHRIEAQVEDLLARELARQCKTGDYSSQNPGKMPEAKKFLERARKYEITFPDQ